MNSTRSRESATTTTTATSSDDDPSSEPNFSHSNEEGGWIYKQMPTPPGAMRFEDGNWWITTETEKPEFCSSCGEMHPDGSDAALFLMDSGALVWLSALTGRVLRIWAPGRWTGVLDGYDYSIKTPEGRQIARKAEAQAQQAKRAKLAGAA
jgi:hypothetical protein